MSMCSHEQGTKAPAYNKICRRSLSRGNHAQGVSWKTVSVLFRIHQRQRICSARILGEHNNMTRSEVAEEVDRRRLDMRNYLNKAFAGGEARLVIPKGAAQSSELIRAVILANGENINRELIDQGFGQTRSLRPAAHQEPRARAQGPRTHPAIHAWLSCSFSLTRTGSKALSVLPYRKTLTCSPDQVGSSGIDLSRLFLFIHQGAIRGIDGLLFSRSLSVPLSCPAPARRPARLPLRTGRFSPQFRCGNTPQNTFKLALGFGYGFLHAERGGTRVSLPPTHTFDVKERQNVRFLPP